MEKFKEVSRSEYEAVILKNKYDLRVVPAPMAERTNLIDSNGNVVAYRTMPPFEHFYVFLQIVNGE